MNPNKVLRQAKDALVETKIRIGQGEDMNEAIFQVAGDNGPVYVQAIFLLNNAGLDIDRAIALAERRKND